MYIFYPMHISKPFYFRLWDVQNENNCIKVCRGHMSHVNSVKFSPDGLWIASANETLVAKETDRLTKIISYL